LEQRRHVIELPSTENNPSSGMEDGLIVGISWMLCLVA